PAARYAPDHTLVIHGGSKGYALTGWRIGFGAGPRELIQAMNRLQGQSTSGANAVAQHAMVAALNEVEKTAEFQRMTNAAYRERRDVLVRGLNSLGLATPLPQGAFYAMADTSPLDPDEGRAAVRLLEEARVAVVPGTDFEAPGLVRLSYATSLDRIEEALRRIEALLGGCAPQPAPDGATERRLDPGKPGLCRPRHGLVGALGAAAIDSVRERARLSLQDDHRAVPHQDGPADPLHHARGAGERPRGRRLQPL